MSCVQATVEARAQAPPLGLLIFSCNGRGQALYGEPNYDSSTLASFVPVPASGMFCNGARNLAWTPRIFWTQNPTSWCTRSCLKLVEAY